MQKKKISGRPFFITFLGILLATLPSVAQHATFPNTKASAFSLLKRGINLGNTLEPPLEGDWNNGPAQAYYFDAYKEAGFTTVRVPVRWDEHTAKEFPYEVDPAFLDRVEEVTDWGLERGLYVILNAHHEEWLKENYSAENQMRFDSIWSQVAARFKDKPDKLLFELINEPKGLTKTQVDELNTRVLGIIRQTNPTRTVIYSGNEWSNSNELLNAAIPEDDNLMGYYHSYDPWHFGGEGEGTWGTASDIAAVEAKFNTVSQWSAANGIPVMLSEFGAVHACHYNSRMHFYAVYTEMAQKYGIAFQVWDDGGMFGVYQREDSVWDEVKDILIYTFPQSPNGLTIAADTSQIRLQWNNRASYQDSITVQRRINEGRFEDYTKRAPDSTSCTDTAITPGNSYYYRLITRYNDTTIHSYPIKARLLPTEREPFHGEAVGVPGTIEAEDFDTGGEGLTYHDEDQANQGGASYRGGAVDIEERNDGGYHIGYVAQGEWLEYTIDVAQTAQYEITAHLASENAGGKCKLSFANGQAVTFTAENTGSWETTTAISQTVEIEAGEQIMRIAILNDEAFNIDKFGFAASTGMRTPQSETRPRFYPNPAQHTVHYQTAGREGIQEISFHNLQGYLVYRNPNPAQKGAIDVSGLPAGLYIIHYLKQGQWGQYKLSLSP